MRIDLDSLCGMIFTYRELFECGNTWKQAAARGAPVNNVPLQEESFEALRLLCSEIVDPLAVAFGRPQLTYGFAGPPLTRLVSGQIAPDLDQHAAHERNSRGEPICSRLGAAVDLLFPDRSAQEVARWIFDHRRFDRLYLYGDDRPFHVSVGPQPARSVVEMRRGPTGRRIPRVLRW